jgi:hypothetical protein
MLISIIDGVFNSSFTPWRSVKWREKRGWHFAKLYAIVNIRTIIRVLPLIQEGYIPRPPVMPKTADSTLINICHVLAYKHILSIKFTI